MYECDGFATWRREQGFNELISIGRENPGSVRTTFGVIDSQRDEMPLPLQASECQMRCYPPRGRFTSVVFIDGSGLSPDIDWLTRAGWSAVSIRPGSEEVLAAAYGPVP
eukprot:7773731-Pyramimonas_sp.AAC.1